MRKIIFLGLFISLFVILENNNLLAQTDTEFWFVKPCITQEHTNGSFKFVFTTREFEANITIEMPAEPAFTPVSLTIPPYTSDEYIVTEPSGEFFLMENNTLLEGHPDIIGKKAIHVESTAPITAYLSQTHINNSDIYTFKGSNGIGKEFIIPFQEHGSNQRSSYNERAFSSIEIIGIEDGTIVEITPPAGKSVFRSALYQNETNPYTITLNRGEVYTCAPGWDPTVTRNNLPNSGWWGVEGNQHLGGIIVKVLSGYGVAVVKKDDSVRRGTDVIPPDGGWDIIADQWVPYIDSQGNEGNLIGTEYAILRGGLENGWEYVYAAAPENNTRIWWGNNLDTTITPENIIINKGEQVGIQFDNIDFANNILEITSNKPLSVLHVSGEGKEMGGAVIPPLNKCSGSTSVSFARDIPWSLYINLITRTGAEDNFLIDGVVRNDIINPSSFVPVGTSGEWLATQISYASDDFSDFPVGIVKTFSNTEDVFHLGLINGNYAGGCRYGYYSDFNEIRAGAVTINEEFNPSSTIRACMGESVQLYANGGTDYNWWPTENLSDANSSHPTAFVDGYKTYYVEVFGACNYKDTATVTIEAIEVPTANFTINTNSGVSPLTVKISDIDSAYSYKWFWDDNDLSSPDYESESNLSFTHTYNNYTNETQIKFLTLIVENEFGCSDTLKQTITIEPQITNTSENSYWFVIPDISEYHSDRPVRFLFTTTDSPADITIEMPANAEFTPINISVPANTTVQKEFNTPEEIYNIENRALIEQLSLPLNEQDNISEKGILVRSSSPITAYYEINANNNSDLWVLKGESGLGENFYVPFQDIGQNRNHTFLERGFSTIEIIAIDDNTEVDIYPSKQVFRNGNNPNHTGAFTITLNKGEVYSLAPGWDPTVQHGTELDLGWFGVYRDQHIGGTHIHVKNSKNIAVIIKDDSVCEDLTESPSDPHATANSWGGWDIIADQLVPLKSLGKEYIALRGDLLSNEEFLFAVATENNTKIWWTSSSIDTTIESVDAIVNEGDQIKIPFPSSDTYKYVIANKKLSVLHVTGTGTEMGGAILPAIDNSSGSTEVGFTRSTSYNFHLNLLVKSDSKDGFLINGVAPIFFNESNFTDIPGTQWSVARVNNITTTNIPVETTTVISNTKGEFHLGVVNEVNLDVGCRYGYFSNYSSNDVSVKIIGHDSTNIKTCLGNDLKFKASGGISYSWSPTTYLDKPLTAAPLATLPLGMHTYAVTINRWLLGDTTLNVQVEVHENSEALFDVDITSGCSPLQIEFENLSTHADTFLIDWENDGIFDTKFNNTSPQTILHTYMNLTDRDTVYTILLKAWDKQKECFSTHEKHITVHPQVSADFSIDIEEGCSPLAINITNNSSIHDSIYISFGDGNAKYFKDFNTLEHIYTNTGVNVDTNLIEFIVYNQQECTDTLRKNIIVYPEIIADFSIDSTEGCSPLSIHFTNTSYGTNISSWSWDFDDTTTSNVQNPFPKTYTNTSGSTEINDVELTITSSYGCTSNKSIPVTVYSSVIIAINPIGVSSCDSIKVDFETRLIPEIEGTSFYWDFADSTFSDLREPTHVFRNTTSDSIVDYRVYSYAETPNGCINLASSLIGVKPYVKAEFSLDINHGCSPLEINAQPFNQVGNYEYRWDFGDETHKIDSEANIQNHIYPINTTGSDIVYNITLEVVDLSGICRDSYTLPVTVYSTPIAEFTSDITEGCNPLIANFTNTSTNAVSYTWDFGDGENSSLDSPSHLFENPTSTDMIFNVSLKAESDHGCKDSSFSNITVYSNLEANFSANAIEGCSPLNSTFENLSFGNETNTYQWFINNNPMAGSPTDLSSFNHTIENQLNSSQDHEIKLLATNPHGCTSEHIDTMTVYPEVTFEFTDINHISCFGASDGSITVNPLTGIAPFTYQWSNGETTPTIYGLDGDLYKVVVTDINGCNKTSDFIAIEEPPQTSIDLRTTNISCYGMNDGSIELSLIDENLSYQWSTGSTDAIITNLLPGTYSVTVTSQNNCHFTGTSEITEPDEMYIFTDSYSDSICPTNNGYINISVEGGRIPYSYIWSSGQQTEDISNLMPGIYEVSVKDNSGCVKTNNYKIDSIMPYEGSEICMVTVDPELEKNILLWETTSGKNIAYYNMYRYNSESEEYKSISVIPYNNSGEYIDYSANPEEGSYKYKISNINICALESSLSKYHKTLFLSAATNNELIHLNWDTYEIESGSIDLNSYLLFGGQNSTDLSFIDTIPVTETSYIINNVDLSNKYYYRITGLKEENCIDNGESYNLISSNLVSTDIQTELNNSLSKDISLAIYPNPFKDELSIQYIKDSDSKVRIEIFDVVGSKITTIVNESNHSGLQKHCFIPDNYGYSTGIYYLRFLIDNQTICKKVIQIQ